MTSNKHEAASAARPNNGRKALTLAVIVGAVFILSYNFAMAKSGTPAQVAQTAGLAQPQGTAGSASAGGGGCCGGGGAPVEGATTVEGDVQKIAVDTSTGSFGPNVIKAKAGVPIEIAFSQSGGGCLSGVYFPDFNISEDLTAGGKTVKLPALEKGTYTFYCQMQMVSAQIVVE